MDVIMSAEAVVSTKSRSFNTGSLLTSLGVSLTLCVAYITVFCILRTRVRSVYEPRTFVVAEHFRTPPTSSSVLGWLPVTLKVKTSSILESSGLDAYFFLRYILVVMALCGCTAIPLLIVLLPIHLTGNREGVSGLDKLSTLSISDEQKLRHIAHLMLCVMCTLGSLLFFKYELDFYFRVRTNYILHQEDAPGFRSTLLVKGLNKICRSEKNIHNLFAGLSGTPASHGTESSIKRVWFNKDYSALHALVMKRAKIVDKLELLELWVIERCLGVGNPVEMQCRQNKNKDATITGNLWREYMSETELAQMNGTIGGKLTFLKSELNKLNSQIFQMQCQDNLFPATSSCFVQFNDKLSAFIASRSINTEDSLNSANCVFDRVHPADIIWSNLNTESWYHKISEWGAISLNFVFVFGWAAPIAAVTIMTQAEVMSEWMPKVHWLVQSPRVTQLMSSVLSPLMISCLTCLVPIIFRFLARMKGFPTHTRVEMDVQKYLFLFMYFQLFLIVTLATGLPGLIVKTLVNTSEGAISLANSLPKATTFFISYLMASCMTTGGNALLQSQQLVMALWNHRRGKTPRQKLQNHCRYSKIYWGSVFPTVTNVGAIAIAYALISPIILLSAVVGLVVLYVAFKYRILYCYVPRCVADGDYYPKAIFQLFSGFYCQQVALLGTLLVNLQLDLAVVAAALIVVTIISQHYLHRMFLDMNARIPLRSLSNEANIETGCVAGTIATPKEKQETPHNLGSSLSVISCTPQLGRSPLIASPMSSRTLCEGRSPNKSHSDFPESPIHLENANFPGSFAVPSCSAALASLRGDMTSHSFQSSWSNSIIQGAASIAVQETWKGLFNALTSDFNKLTPSQQEHIEGQLFEHPDKRMQRPCIWLPRDWKGVAQDQVREMQTVFTDIRSSCSGSEINSDGTIMVDQAPADFDPLEVMKI